MIRKIGLTLIAAVLASGVTAQEGWTHSLAPAFAAPFDFLMLPWPADTVESVSVSNCWPDEAPPFLGATWRFWCYAVPGTANAAADTIDAAVTDAGLRSTPVYSDWFVPGDGQHAHGGFWNNERTVDAKYYAFMYDGQAFVGLASGAP